MSPTVLHLESPIQPLLPLSLIDQKIIFEEPKPFSLFLTSREALETVAESSCRSTLIQLDQFLKDLIKLIVLTVAKSFNHKSLKFNDCRRWNRNSLSLTCRL